MTTSIDPTAANNAARQARAVLDAAIAVADQRGRLLGSKIAAARKLLEETSASGRAITGETASETMLEQARARTEAAAELFDAAGRGRGTASALDEWKECRVTIDRFDKILVDLRKTGFGFITALAGASSFIFDKLNGFPPKVSLLGMLVLLIVTLYLIDVTHQTWLVVAVKRARALEAELSFSLTTLIGEEFKVARAAAVGFALYLFLLTASCTVFWFTVGLDEPVTSGRHVSVAAIFGVGLLCLIGVNVMSSTDSAVRRRFVATMVLLALGLSAAHFAMHLF